MNTTTRTLENTGTCACCGKNVKLGFRVKEGKIGSHGFRVKKHFQNTQGSCYGVGYDPLEVSKEGLRAVIEAIEKEMISIQTELDELTSGQAKMIRRSVTSSLRSNWNAKKDFTPESWQSLVDRRISKLESDLATLQSELNGYVVARSYWQPRPLPI